MPDFNTLLYLFGQYGPFILVTIAVFLALEAIFVTISQKRHERGVINERLRLLERTDDGQAVLIELRRNRGLTAEGNFRLPFVAFNRLLLQSGLRMSLTRLLLVMVAIACAAGLMVFGLTGNPLPTAVSFALAGAGLPLLLMFMMRARRRRRFEGQLPEAIDVIVRSLKAGHPVAVAIAMVAREMPDPIGTEFGMVADEMTYGLDLQAAIENLRARAGQSDMSFLAVAISIQAKTGGNLAEILSNLSHMVRERAKLRGKIRALSSEGRFSATVLSILPVVLFAVFNLANPRFYSDVRDDFFFMPAAYLAVMLWVTGIFTLYRMVNFRF